ncbi:polyphosphate kinase 1 [Marinirhabdus gelatinilytica]|uniref:Polyphosphate kinase n=1 Tax=Marinirhabdus gelatinilytica TaxID=1703343 RepID=A0A370Q640_9FLAO|nr:polyphosphate kinase 1 [Marinirhabdus gelatinilytica]RDK83825.1 polyphosphate kinase [Marinirhabdus gelatinilytica]
MGKLYNSKYYHRDLSWLRFNHRVLQEAADKKNPLYERIKFLAIFSSNLDEFFKVRVSDIRQIKKIEKPLRKKLITKPNKVLREIKKQVEIQQEEFGAIFKTEIIPELKKHNIHLIGHKEFSTNQKEIAKTYYQETLKQKTEVNTYNTSEENQVFVENEALYLTTQLSDTQFAVINIPEDEPRFFTFPKHNGKHYITFIDDILKYNLRQNPKMERDITFYSIKKSRDAELYIENELSGNLAEKIKNSLSKRETGQATRLLIDKRMPKDFQEILKSALDVYNADIVNGGTYHNFKDFFGFPNPTETKLSNEKLTPLPHPVLAGCDSILREIEKKDQLLHYPYQSFESLIKLLEEAAKDPEVTTIKMTIYRAAAESRLNDAIVTAAKNGKKVVVFIEVKARFDERNNLKWGKIFEDNGATVIYSFPDIKIHSKILYIEKKTEDGKKRFGYIATGNFNEKTAKLYTDFGLMTADKKICKDLNKVFLVLQQKILVPKTKRLLVSPYTTRSGFTELVQTEMQLARAGQPANITLKMNSLEDKAMIKLLYRASNAGVTIRLLVRGICSLVPGVKGQSENIHITSILDRFLEHGRVYIFGNNGDPKIFIGSADWMKRNLSHRIEVVTPILDEDHKKTLLDLIELQLQDNVKARIIDEQQKNTYVSNDSDKLQAQLATYDYFK